MVVTLTHDLGMLTNSSQSSQPNDSDASQQGGFPAWLQARLDARGVGPTEFARSIGVSHPTVLAWLQGKMRPRPETCQKLANYLGLPLDRVLVAAGHYPRASEKASDVDYRAAIRRQFEPDLAEDLIDMIDIALRTRRKLDARNEHYNG